jgi:hypothetical protein
MYDLSYHFVTDDIASVHADDIGSFRREVSILCEKKKESLHL